MRSASFGSNPGFFGWLWVIQTLPFSTGPFSCAMLEIKYEVYMGRMAFPPNRRTLWRMPGPSSVESSTNLLFSAAP